MFAGVDREHGHGTIRNARVLKREHRPRASLAGGAAADRVHDDEGGARLGGERLIDLLGRGERLDADRGQLLPQRFNGLRIVNGR